MSTFNERIQMLKSLGVEYGTEYEYRGEGEERKEYRLDFFTSVRLPLTAAEWCSLCMSGGENYIGGCCGQSSATQDILNHIFRHDSGFPPIRDLAELVDMLNAHDPITGRIPFDSLDKLDDPLPRLVERAGEPQNWEKLSPWDKIALVWHIVKDCWRPQVPAASGPHRTELDDAVSVLSRGMQAISWERLFRGNKDVSSQAIAQRALLLAKLLPAWETMNRRITELDLGGFDGWALIDKRQGPDEIAMNAMGYCIFATREECDNLLKLWRETEVKYKGRKPPDSPIDEIIGIRRVRVSPEKGAEFLD